MLSDGGVMNSNTLWNISRNEVLHVMSQINWCMGKLDFVFYEGTYGPHDKYYEIYTMPASGVTW
jgi:hypothetical protein